MTTKTNREGLHLAAPRNDEPSFFARVELHGIPLGQAEASISAARRKLLAFLADSCDWDWPLTFWLSTEPCILAAPGAGRPDSGTASYVVILRVVGDGASRRLARAAEKAGLTKRGTP